MNEVKQTIVINKPAREVFDFIVNPHNTPKWVSSVVEEKINENSIKIGTLYSNRGTDGNWSEFEVTDFEEGHIFELTKKNDSHHIKYMFESLDDGSCKLEYHVWVAEGEVSERFSSDRIQEILKNLKTAVEAIN